MENKNSGFKSFLVSSAGKATIIAVFYLIIFGIIMLFVKIDSAYLALIVMVAFAYFNLFGKAERNTKLFMGDSGSLSLGFTLGFLAVKCAMQNTNIWPYRPEAIIVPITLLFVPTADVVRVTLYRFKHHKPLFDADKNHIHHKLMRTGMNQHQALGIILAMALGYIAINGLLYQVFHATIIVIIDIVLYCIVNMCINRKMKVTE